MPGAAAALSFAENQGCQPWGGTGPTSKGPVVGRVDEVADDAFRKDVPRAGVRLRPSSTDTVRVAVRLSHRQPGHLGCQLRWRRGVELRWLVALWLPREARGMPCRRSCQKEMTGCLRLPPARPNVGAEPGHTRAQSVYPSTERVRRRSRYPPRRRPYAAGRSWRSSWVRLQILVPSARMYGSVLAASSRTVARSTPSSSAHRSSGAAIGRPRSGSCQVPTEAGYRTQVRERIENAA